MSITDEMRAYANEADWNDWKADKLARDLRAIANRIDAEHERLKQELPYTIDMVPITDETMAEHGWVRLPVDADGKYIHIGDVMEWVRYEGSDQTIVRKVSGVGDGVFFAWSDEQGRYAQYEAKAYRHYHAPTVEDVLEQALNEAAMLDRPEGYWPSAADITNIVNSLAAKLRLADDGKEQ